MTSLPPRPEQPEQSLSGSVPAPAAPPEAPAGPEEVPASPEAPSTPAPAGVSSPPSSAEPAEEASSDDTRSAKSDDKDSHQTKVRIDTPGATIEIEANEPLAEVVATALRLFHEAGGWPQVPYRSAGFAQAERRDTPPVQASSMPYGPGAYPVQMP